MTAITRPRGAAVYDGAPIDRQPPNDEDAERAVLNVILWDERALMTALEIIDAESFYRERHRKIFRAAVTLLERGGKVDPITVASELQTRGELEACGGKTYIGVELVGLGPVEEHIGDYARIVREKAERRRLIERLGAASQELWHGDAPVATIAADLQAQLLATASQSRGQGFVRVKDDIWPLMESIEARARLGAGAVAPNVVPTGYPEIDEQIAGGIERGEFMVIAGVPGGCKTATAMNVGLNAAVAEAPKGVLFVSAEMTRQKLHMRNLANLGRIDFAALRKAELRDDDYPRLARAAGVLQGAPLWVDQTPTPAIEDIVAKCRKEKAEHPEIALVIVDFVQLVQRRQEQRRARDDNRAAELTTISYALKALAKELDVAVIATCQVDAADIDKRTDKRPRPGDARWSQGMREAADLWVSCYRAKMYDPDPMSNDTLELLFQKARDAEPFTAILNWVGHHMRLTSPKQRARDTR